jgi:hypothetical protein
VFWNGQRAPELPDGWPAGWAPTKKRAWYNPPRWVKIVAGIVLWPITLAVASLAGAVALARWSLVKERRALCAPGWLLLIAAVSWWLLPAPAWSWALFALALDLTTLPAVAARWDRMPRAWLSERERQLFARTCAGIALVMVVTSPAPFLPRGMFLAAAVGAGSVFWWMSRRARPASRAMILDRWDQEVVADLPQLAGTWLEFDDERGTGVLELATSKASDVADLDEDVERTLNQHRGTVTIAPDPRLTVRQVRVAFTDHEYGSRLRMFDGSTLANNGRFIVAYAKGGLPIYGEMWWSEGALNVGIIAPPGRGKGSIMRLIAITGALTDRVELVGACGKQGQGIGYLSDAFRIFTDRHEESVDLIHGFLMAVRERGRRYAGMKRDSFIPGPGDPYLYLLLDEPQWIYAYEPRVIEWIEEISGTSRSAGCGIVKTLHKGDGPGWGTTKTRSNMIGNGWRWFGPTQDNQAKSTGLQGTEFDPADLPDEPGWAAILDIAGQPVVPARTLWVPNRADLLKAQVQNPDDDITEAGFAPFGFVEDWLTKTIHPELHEATLAALGTPDPLQQMRREQAARQEAKAAEEGDELLAADGSHLSLVDSTPPPADAWTRIHSVLQEVAPDGLLRGQIADRAHVSARHVTDTLNQRSARYGDVVKDEKSRWRLAS